MLRIKLILAIAALMPVMDGVAQIRIISREDIERVANPSTVDSRAMVIEGGNAVSFGRIDEQGGAWECRVAWQNQGDKPLVVMRTSSSCSCLKVEAERNAVKPSEKGYITLRYYPQGHPGEVSQRVMIYTNLSDKQPTAIITVSGVVTPSTDHRGDYPQILGPLLLRRDTVRARQGEEARIACMNGGEDTLRLSADTLLSPQGIKAYTEPRELNAGEEGDLVITLPERLNFKSVQLYLQGLNVAPRERRVVIMVEE